MTTALDKAVLELVRECKPAWAVFMEPISDCLHIVGYKSADDDQSHQLAGFGIALDHNRVHKVYVYAVEGSLLSVFIPLSDPDMAEQVWGIITGYYEWTVR